MVASSKEPAPRTVETFVIDGQTFVFPAQPFCDCTNPVWKGATKRGDGAWVRPCCMRPTKRSYERRKAATS